MIRWIEQLICSHRASSQIYRSRIDGRLYLECMDCGKHSKGIDLATRF
jgi:hypothetical protein